MAHMTSRERMLTALNNGRPDRMPCQVHGWMNSYLVDYLDGMDQWQAYARFDMDHAIYVSPAYSYSDKTMANWQVARRFPWSSTENPPVIRSGRQTMGTRWSRSLTSM